MKIIMEHHWETVITLNPEYLFSLDRSIIIETVDESVYFIEHANVWYTSTGGVQALDTMLADLEGALLN